MQDKPVSERLRTAGTRPCFCYLTDLTVIFLNGICGIYKLMNSRNVLVVFVQFIPVLMPEPDDDRILFAPFLFQLKKFIFRRFFIYSLINEFQILQEFLLIFGAYIFDGITNLMCNTKLYRCIGINTLNCFRKNFSSRLQAIRISSTPRF